MKDKSPGIRILTVALWVFLAFFLVVAVLDIFKVLDLQSQIGQALNYTAYGGVAVCTIVRWALDRRRQRKEQLAREKRERERELAGEDEETEEEQTEGPD